MQQQQQHVLALAKLKQMRPQRRLTGDIEALPRRRRKNFGKGLLADGRDRKPRPCGGCLQDQLPRHPQLSGKMVRKLSWRSTTSPSAASKASRSSLPFSRAASGMVVGRARPFQAIDEPQPALRKRQRDLGRPRNRTQGRTCRLVIVETFDAPGVSA